MLKTTKLLWCSHANPWTKLPLSAPYALTSDLPLLHAFNAAVEAKYQYDLSLFPEPYFGNLELDLVRSSYQPGQR